jgi:serine/threonine protein kinase
MARGRRKRERVRRGRPSGRPAPYATVPRVAIAPGELLDGKYRIDAVLGHGGMGAVYRATHTGTTRTVAVKVIRPDLASHEEFVERFRREAEAAGRLRHPNVVDVTDFGFATTDDGHIAYLVMEFLDGCTLAEVLAEEQRLPVDWVVDVIEQVASALDEAHAQGIVHRIWLEPNRRGGYTVKVLDFGLVKLGELAEPERRRQGRPLRPVLPPHPEVSQPANVGDAVTIGAPVHSPDLSPTIASSGDYSQTLAGAGLTRAGAVTGTPLYMSPEQCRGDRVDARSDIYSLGVVAYRMLAGEPPFQGDTATLLQQHIDAAPPPLRRRSGRVPRRVAGLVMAALAKDPAARPPRAGGLASALRAAAEGSGNLLRQALGIYGDRFPALIRVSAIAYLPLAIFLGVLAIVDARGGEESTLTAIVVILMIISSNIAAYLAVPMLAAPLVVQAFVAPLQPASVSAAWRIVRRRWRPLAVATAMVAGLVAGASLLLVIPGIIVAILHVLYAPVVVMEDVGAVAALRRARRLALRSWSTVLVITVLQFALPVLVWNASVTTIVDFALDEHWQPSRLNISINAGWRAALLQLLNVFVAPLAATMTALLYLKSRQAGGESLQGAIDHLRGQKRERAWEVRMRSRSRTPAIADPSAPSPAG